MRVQLQKRMLNLVRNRKLFRLFCRSWLLERSYYVRNHFLIFLLICHFVLLSLLTLVLLQLPFVLSLLSQYLLPLQLNLPILLLVKLYTLRGMIRLNFKQPQIVGPLALRLLLRFFFLKERFPFSLFVGHRSLIMLVFFSDLFYWLLLFFLPNLRYFLSWVDEFI